MKYDLKIVQQINHYNGDKWFELFEIESGEVLYEGDTYEECLSAFKNVINPDRYELLPD